MVPPHVSDNLTIISSTSYKLQLYEITITRTSLVFSRSKLTDVFRTRYML
ncbi:hypothetical protein PPA04_14150 [Pediococcus parvulus]|nr:hypothetical protein PPA04_14150 [Pediococcus parvulus]GHC13916.1 hypothetical protein GCM10008912_16820 [Pediococcus parvulus]